MRIRRHAAGALPLAQASSSPSCFPRSPLAPRAPSPAPASRSETAPARGVKLPEREADRPMCKGAGLDPSRPSGGGDRQEGKAEESDKGTGNEKRGGEEDGGSELEHGQRPVHVIPSTPAESNPEEQQRPAEVEDKKREDSRRAEEEEEEEKSIEAAAMCKKGDGKGWHCRRAAQCGYSLCQYHLDKLRFYYSYSQAKRKRKKKKKPQSASLSEKSTAAGVAHRQGASQQKQKDNKKRVEEQVSSTGPGVWDSFYYYSGFGPRWGKRRRCRPSGDATMVHDGGASQEAQLRQLTGAAAATAAAGEGGEECEYEYDSGGRDGRPWKSRALSSLL